jgi:hypothetical protein
LTQTRQAVPVCMGGRLALLTYSVQSGNSRNPYRGKD